jgi:hypothetical protein
VEDRGELAIRSAADATRTRDIAAIFPLSGFVARASLLMVADRTGLLMNVDNRIQIRIDMISWPLSIARTGSPLRGPEENVASYSIFG